MPTLLAAIPYRTLPDFALGPITIRTFGLLVALGIVLGTVIGSRYVANRGVDAEQYTSLATRAVIGGLIGARLAWVVTHLDEIGSPIDVIAVWEGGMQFSGGLLLGALVGWLSARGRFSRTQRWHIMDGSAIGLTAGLAVGRLGCIAVGEHFGSQTDFFLGMTYLGGGTVEPVAIDQTIHNTAFYEFLHLAVLGLVMAVMVRRAADRGKPWPLGMYGALFLTWYGTWRFITDIVRVNDARLAGLTGAQWASIGVVLLGLWLFATMGSRKVSEEGRAIVPVTSEPRSAITVLTGDAAAAAAAEEAGASDTATPVDTAPDTDPDPAAAATDDEDADQPWADRADVRAGSAEYVAGVRVVDPDPDDTDARATEPEDAHVEDDPDDRTGEDDDPADDRTG